MSRAWRLLVAALILTAPAVADETTFCNAKITTLPYTITTQGHYCFDRNLSTAIATGSAITINSDFVVLDLNNFKLGGGSAGLATQAYGISAVGRKNITIRNGNIRGFKAGVWIEGSAATTGGHVIENNVFDSNTSFAIAVAGDGIVIRNNLINATGGSPTGTSLAISTEDPGFVVVSDNIINNTFSLNGGAFGIYAGGVMNHNVVRMGSALGQTFGIRGGFVQSVCRDNTVENTSNPYSACDLVGDNYPVVP